MSDTGFDPSLVEITGQSNFIGGRRVRGLGQAVPLNRPSDGTIHCDLDSASWEQVDEACEDAHRAFAESGWATCPPRDRIRVMRRWADLIERDARQIARLESFCSTRPIADSTAWDVTNAAECLRFFAELADKQGGEVAATRSDNLGMVLRQPYGVIGLVIPWNFPMVTTAWKVGPALAAGNAVVVKPSEMTPYSALRLAELAIEAGLPAGLFNVVQGTGNAVGDDLVRHARVRKVSFTGSTSTGARVMAACAETGIKPATLELGGKSPQIVHDDADIERAALAIAKSITGNAGQVCVAGSRLIAHESIAGELVERIAGHFAQVRPGATWDGATTFPPIISDLQCTRIEGIVERSRAAGAEVLVGGQRIDACGKGAFYAPTILTHVDMSSEAVRSEIFGPVLTVQTFAGEAEAMALADHPEYGLAAGVHTRDIGRAMRAMRAIEAGTVWINRYGRSGDFVLPTGGFKSSGYGRDLGKQAFEAAQQIKTALIDFAA
ncbi:aldehyde dehydrogenase family protein [Novosphingobium lindaniclasticum]